ncbi:MAG: alpha/beta hydrolase fold domain-containing protein [Nocardioides sp.]
MGLAADGTAYLLQRSAPRTVRYGESLRFAGSDLPAPVLVRVPTRRGFVGVHVYRPDDERDDHPVYVHLRGGAFVMRYPEMDDFFCRYVVATCVAVVLNVNYDVAPQVRYPVAQEQAHDVFAWVCTHPGDLRADSTRVAFGGFSAGGGLAAAAALQARDLGTRQPVMQLLAVPALDVAAPVGRRGTSMITPRVQRLVRRTYFKDASRRGEPYASPVLADDLDGGREQAAGVLASVAGSLQDALGTRPVLPRSRPVRP